MTNPDPDIGAVAKLTPDIVAEQLDKLKRLFPEAITEGKVDKTRLLATLDAQDVLADLHPAHDRDRDAETAGACSYRHERTGAHCGSAAGYAGCWRLVVPDEVGGRGLCGQRQERGVSLPRMQQRPDHSNL